MTMAQSSTIAGMYIATNGDGLSQGSIEPMEY